MLNVALPIAVSFQAVKSEENIIDWQRFNVTKTGFTRILTQRVRPHDRAGSSRGAIGHACRQAA